MLFIILFTFFVRLYNKYLFGSRLSIKKKIYYFILLVIIAFITDFCANVVSPTGGPKDITPPEIRKCIPENKSLYFSEDKIIITFDEYVQLKNINQVFVSSPPLIEKPEFRLRNKT